MCCADKMKKVFDDSCRFIDSEYKRLGHTLGYRFFLCPQNLLNSQTRILYLGLNPGGNERLLEHPYTCCEAGTAFFTESWKGKVPGTENLQRQTQLLFEKIQRRIGGHGTAREFVDSQILSAYFIPFRSPGFLNLNKREESIKSAKKLWGNIFSYWLPDYIITLGKETFAQIGKIFLQKKFVASQLKAIPSGWRDYTLHVREFYKGDRTIYVGGLLHLGRFKIMGSLKYTPAIDKFLDMMNIG